MPSFSKSLQLFKEGLDRKLFWTYCLAFKQQAWETFWGATLLGIPFGLYTLYHSPARLFFLVYVLIVVFVTGYYLWHSTHTLWLADHNRLVPGVRVNRVWRQSTPTSDGAGNLTGFSLYVQIEPECVAEAPVYNCEGKLLRVRKFINSRWEPTEWNETATLEWSQETAHSPIKLEPGVPKRLNIFFVHSSNWQITPCVPSHQFPLRAAVLFARPFGGPLSVFRFDIAITCQDRPGDQGFSLKPLTVCLEVYQGTDPSNPHVEIVEE